MLSLEPECLNNQYSCTDTLQDDRKTISGGSIEPDLVEHKNSKYALRHGR